MKKHSKTRSFWIWGVEHQFYLCFPPMLVLKKLFLLISLTSYIMQWILLGNGNCLGTNYFTAQLIYRGKNLGKIISQTLSS